MNDESPLPEDFRDQWSNVEKADVMHLIRATENFMVWIDPTYDIDWKTSKKFDKEKRIEEAEFQYTIATIGELECVPTSQHGSAERLNYKRILGEALVLAFGQKYEESKKLLESAHIYIQKRNIELARKWQLITALTCGAIAGVTTLGALALRHWLQGHLGVTTFEFAIAFLLGCLGAVFSISLRLGHLNPTSDAPRSLHVIEAISKIAAGGIGATMIIAAYKSDMLLSGLQQSASPMAAFALLSLSAGASERLAPSIVETIGNQKEEKHD